MAKSNKTDFALLGVLNIEPMSGYDIRGFVRMTIDFFWQESFGQIYPALRRLHTRRLVTKKRAKQSQGPARYVYSITAKGQAALSEWLAIEPDRETIRNELLLKLFFGVRGTTSDQIQHIESLQARQQNLLARLEGVEQTLMTEAKDDPGQPYMHSTLRYGQLIAQARMAWCKETLADLRGMKDASRTAG